MNVDTYMIISTISSIITIILFIVVLVMADDIRALREKYAPKKKTGDGFSSAKEIDKWLNEEPIDPSEPKKEKKK